VTTQAKEYRRSLGPWPERVLVGLTLTAVAVAAGLVERGRVNQPWSTFDLRVYWSAGQAVLHGHGIYAVSLPTGLPAGFCKAVNCPTALGFVYPPFAALVLAPLSLMSVATLRLVWYSGLFLALESIVWLCLGWAGVRNRWIRLAVAVAAAAVLPFFDPVGQELQAGQVNVFLMLLVLADLRRPDGARGKGAGVGLAAALKLTPLIFIPYLVLTRRIREAVTAVAVFAGAIVVGFIAEPSDSWRYWTSYAWQPQRNYPQTGNISNQSLRAVLARLVHSNTPTAAWFAAAVVVFVIGMVVAIILHRRGLELEAVIACGFTAALVSPIAWVYHWVWFVPLLVCMAARAARARPASRSLGWLVLAAAIAAVPAIHPYTWLTWYQVPSGGWDQLQADSLALCGLVLLLLGALLGRTPPAPGDPVQPAGQPR
jgi:alpha-1,2-mannosyltransferase